MDTCKDVFIEICESLRLHELTRYSTDELLIELECRGVVIHKEATIEGGDQSEGDNS